jgi:3-dehydrosphinganine reductase
LGKQIAKAVAAQGANVTIFARRQAVLDVAQDDILSARLDSTQIVNAISVDLSDALKVDSVFRAQSTPADVMYCAAGGCPTQCEFFANINSADLESCMQMNYFTAAYTAQSLCKIWIQDEQLPRAPNITKPVCRQIVFINSAGAFLGLPGYTAYTRTSLVHIKRKILDLTFLQPPKLLCEPWPIP